MKIRQILYIALSFLAVTLGLGSYVVAASTLELKETSQEISGKDSESSMEFHASLLAGDRVVMDLYFGTKRFHSDIDYTRNSLTIRSVSRAYGTPVALSVQDIVAFRQLLVSLPPKIKTAGRLARTLMTFVDVMASASPGHPIDINSVPFTNQGFTSICPKIGRRGVAIYTIDNKTVHKDVTVGPVCYKDPALGRCGKGGGPDPGIGWEQHFTQECLNHDVCCGKESGLCGEHCFDEFVDSIPGFFGAPDCGTTAGNWTDNTGFTYVITGGDSGGDPPQDFTGPVTETCGPGYVTGTRTGTHITFTLLTGIGVHNPPAVRTTCYTSRTFNGIYTGCNTANGTWYNTFSPGDRGTWHWKRTNTVTQTDLLSRANAGSRPANK
ncbi:MAG: hypothetical protein ACRECP_07040 [Methylocella sp.]